MNIRIDHAELIVAAGVLLVGTVSAPAGDDVSHWDGDARSAARLVAGTRPVSGAALLRAGIEIRLKPGWHTYWRYPGDAGVPPRFDFKGSQNLKQYTVLWPAPERLPEEGGVSIGYSRDVILPLRIVPVNRGMPVMLRLKLNYAICEKLCVPAEAQSELLIPAGTASLDSALTAAEARVPKKVPAGEGQALAVRSVRREGGAHPQVVVDVAAPAGVPVELFAEGPTPQWALPVPMEIDGAPAGVRRFVFELDGAPPGASYKGARLSITAVAGGEAIEVPIRLD